MQASFRLIGAHVSASGGYAPLCKKAKEIGANCIQFFGGSPVRWNASIPAKEDRELFQEEMKKNGLVRSFLHAPYLINLASPKENLPMLSQALLKRHLEIAAALGVDGVIFHIGSRGDRPEAEAEKIVADALSEILEKVPGSALLIENSAGAGNLVGDQLDEIGRIMGMVHNPRLGCCIDTAHAFGAGILSEFTKEKVDSFVKEIDTQIGLKKLWAIHLNDSKVAAGTNKDRHENIGEGHIGKEGMKNFLSHEKLKDIPVLLEVPGYENEGPDKKNIDMVKSLAK